MSDTLTLTGKTRFRTLHRGFWPFRSAKLVLQVQLQQRTELFTSVLDERPYKVDTSYYWRDAKFEDLTVSDKRELFCRENPR
jgi:hypothetical protein